MPEGPTRPDLEQAIRRLVKAGNRRPPEDDDALAICLQDAVVETTPLGLGLFEGREAFRDFRCAGVSAWTDGLIEWVTTYTDIDEARAAGERLAQERG
jgi:hypothetical protein